MLILLSPAKTLDFDPTDRNLPATKPSLHTEAKKLAAVAKALTRDEVQELMGLSDSLADTAHGYLQAWKAKWDAKGAKQAILAFRGDVYRGFDADTLSDKQLTTTQDRVRILSGLYGVLRPLDLIQPYRLEMGRKLANPRGRDLYAWWGERVTDAINADLAASPTGSERLVVNLASNEYASVVQPERVDARIVTPVFKERRGESYRVLSFFAKQARGAMARHLVRSRTANEKSILAFGADGYAHHSGLSKPDRPVFTRESADS